MEKVDEFLLQTSSWGSRSSGLRSPCHVRLRVNEKGADIVVPLPAHAVKMIVDFLTAMAEKKPVSFIPHAAELTTQQAADFLNVSRPHLVGLIDKGEIAHRMVGTHRRVRVSDLMAYKAKALLQCALRVSATSKPRSSNTVMFRLAS